MTRVSLSLRRGLLRSSLARPSSSPRRGLVGALLASLLIAFVCGACRSATRLDIGYEAPPGDDHGHGQPVFIVPVVDARDPTTTPHTKTLGELAQGTEIKGDQALTRALGRALRDELQALGFRTPRDERQPQLAVTVLEWRWSEDGKDAAFRCALDVAVLDPLGSRVRDRARVAYERNVPGSSLSGAWTSLSEAQDQVFAEVIQRCVRRNRVVLAALSDAR